MGIATPADTRPLARRESAKPELFDQVNRDLRGKGFFVAQLEYGLQLRPLLPDAEILVLNGVQPGIVEEFERAKAHTRQATCLSNMLTGT